MKYIKPILAFVIFIVMQVIASLALTTISIATNPEFSKAVASGDANIMLSAFNPTLVATVVLIANILSIVIITVLRLIDWKSVFNWRVLKDRNVVLPVLIGLIGCFAMNIFLEQCGVEDKLEDLFYSMMSSLWGVIVISIFGPVLEELCFREALIGGLVRRGAKPWVAVLVSAVLFGLIHANPAQSVAGLVIGLILGLLYIKTGNIVLPCILHICNNSFASICCRSLDKGVTFSQLLGSNTLAITLGIVGAVGAIIYFVNYCKNEPTTLPADTETTVQK